jgi:hypothetical protein
MNTFHRITSAVLTSLLASTPTLAHEKGNDEQNQERRFQGFIVGAQVAASRISADINKRTLSNTSLSYEGFTGYRLQTNQDWVFGIEGTLGDRQGNLGFEQGALDFSYLWNWSVTAGKVFGANRDHLLYSKLGVGGIQLRTLAHETLVARHNYKGVQSTVGYERSISPHLGLRLEASYISYDPGFNHLQSKLGLVYTF